MTFQELFNIMEGWLVQPEMDFREMGIPARDNPKKSVAKVGHHWTDANKVISFPDSQVDDMNFHQTEPPKSWQKAWVPDEQEKEMIKRERHQASEIFWPSLPLIYKNRLAKAASEAYAEALGGEGHQWSYDKWMGRVWSQGWRFFGTVYGGIMARKPRHDKFEGWQLKGDYGADLKGKMGIKLGLEYFMQLHGEEPIYTCATPEIYDLINKLFPDNFVKFTGKAAGMILPKLLKHQNVSVDAEGMVHWTDNAGSDHPKVFFANKAFYKALQHSKDFLDEIPFLKSIPPKFLNQFIDILKQLDVFEPEIASLLDTDLDYEWDPEQTKSQLHDIYGRMADKHGHDEKLRNHIDQDIDFAVDQYAKFDAEHPEGRAATHIDVPQTPEDYAQTVDDLYAKHVSPYFELTPRGRDWLRRKASKFGEFINKKRPEFEERLKKNIEDRFSQNTSEDSKGDGSDDE